MAITIEQIKSLRARTGISINLCRQVLEEASGDEDKALQIIQTKHKDSIARSNTNMPANGMVKVYEHNGSKIGVIVEINCDTDFVARTDEFKEFAANVAMHIASSNPLYVNLETIPSDVIEQRKLAAIISEVNKPGKPKPQNIIDNIVAGKINKFASEVCLMKQVYFLSETNETIEQMCNTLSIKFGEQIKIKRFNRYEIG